MRVVFTFNASAKDIAPSLPILLPPKLNTLLFSLTQCKTQTYNKLARVVFTFNVSAINVAPSSPISLEYRLNSSSLIIEMQKSKLTPTLLASRLVPMFQTET